MIDVTAQAYEYAKKVKKVNEGVIEAYKKAYNVGYEKAKRLPDIELLEIIKSRYRSDEKIAMDLGHSDARRGFNEKEKKEAKMHDLIKSFCDQIDKHNGV
jgi:hypothetical protein